MIEKIERAFLPGREDLTLHLHIDEQGQVQQSKLSVIGGREALAMAALWRPKLKGALASLELPTGDSPFEILLRELILKAKGEWSYPYNEDEVCHCRVVSRETIDAAIICGAHTPIKVSEWTSASTACGTCRPDVTAMIAYRLGRTP